MSTTNALNQLNAALDKATLETADPAEAANTAADAALALLDAATACLAQRSKGIGDNQVLAARNATGEVEVAGETLATINQVIRSGSASLNGGALCVPTSAGDKVAGALYVARDQPFTQADSDLLAAFARQAQLALDNAHLRAELNNADVVRAEFISHVTHELRLPMTSIKGYADLMRTGMAGELSPQQLEFLNVITNNVVRMRSLISNLSDMSRIESNRVVLDLSNFPLNNTVTMATSGLKAKIEERNQTLTIDIPKDLPELHLDEKRVSQILENLLVNANLYTPEGGKITVKARQNGDRIEVAVADTGVGIQTNDQTQVFTAFFRSDVAEVRDHPGWGLALHVSHGLAEAMGGSLTFKSTPGKGTTFTLTLPTSA